MRTLRQGIPRVGRILPLLRAANLRGVIVKSYAPQVVCDCSGKFYGNALSFATREEAEQNVADLFSRWSSVTDTRVI